MESSSSRYQSYVSSPEKIKLVFKPKTIIHTNDIFCIEIEVEHFSLEREHMLMKDRCKLFNIEGIIYMKNEQ